MIIAMISIIDKSVVITRIAQHHCMIVRFPMMIFQYCCNTDRISEYYLNSHDSDLIVLICNDCNQQQHCLEMILPQYSQHFPKVLFNIPIVAKEPQIKFVCRDFRDSQIFHNHYESLLVTISFICHRYSQICHRNPQIFIDIPQI